jgi:catechol 2,3-dioxygenase-like lactoylglutathione lyase family enzyme
MQPLRILETCLYAEDVETCAAFYRDVLSLEQTAATPGRFCFFRCGGGMLLLFNPRATEGQGGLAPPHGSRGAGHIAFCIGTDEFDGWRERLASHGIAIEMEQSWAPGALSLYFRDPAGNSVELTTETTWGM